MTRPNDKVPMISDLLSIFSGNRKDDKVDFDTWSSNISRYALYHNKEDEQKALLYVTHTF